MSAPKEIGHIVLNVTDVERSTRFYRDVVGFQVSRYRPDGTGAFLTCGVVHHNLALFKAPAGARPTEKGAIGLNHFAFKVESYRTLQAAHERLVGARATIDHIEYSYWLQCQIFFKDGLQTVGGPYGAIIGADVTYTISSTKGGTSSGYKSFRQVRKDL